MATYPNRIYGSSRNGPYGYYRKTHEGRQLCSDFFYAKNKTEIDKLITAWLAAEGWEKLLRDKVGVFGRPKTIGDYLQKWFDNLAKNKWHPNTTQTYRQDFNKHILTDLTFTALPYVKRIKKSDVAAFRDRINGTDNTKINVMKLVHKAFEDALKLDELEYNPAKHLPNPLSRPESRIKPIESTDEEKLIIFTRSAECSPYWRAFILFALDSAARREEILGLQVGDINFTTGEVNLQRVVVTLKGTGAQVFPRMKTRKSERPIFLCNMTLDAISAYLGQGWPHSGHIFGWDPDSMSGCDGTLWTASRLAKAWKGVLKAAKVPKYGLNATRHTVATRAAGNAPLTDVATLLGHSDTAVTQRYVHSDNAALKSFASKNQAHFEAMFNK